MDGILLINKPKDMTSHDVVNIVRRSLGTKKVGHAGTLDPDATGLLVLGINKGTKIMQYLITDDKHYDATVCFGVSTDTLDKTGEVIEQKEVESMEHIEHVLSQFKGEYTQVPPMYSAIRYNGKKLYEYARKGIEITDRPSRTIKIFDIHQISDILYKDKRAYLSYHVHGSKGLYVRTLSYDIGQAVGYPAHNHQLHRVQAGSFNVEDAYTIDEIKEGNFSLVSMVDALPDLPTLVINDDIEDDIRHGRTISLDHVEEPTLTKIIDSNNNLLALYDKHPEKDVMKAKNVFL